MPAYLFGWAELVMIRAAARRDLHDFAEYLIRVTGNDPSLAPFATYTHWIAAGAIFFAGAVSYTGVKRAGGVVNVMTSLKVLGLLSNSRDGVCDRIASDGGTIPLPSPREASPLPRLDWRWCRCCGSTTGGLT